MTGHLIPCSHFLSRSHYITICFITSSDALWWLRAHAVSFAAHFLMWWLTAQHWYNLHSHGFKLCVSVCVRVTTFRDEVLTSIFPSSSPQRSPRRWRWPLPTERQSRPRLPGQSSCPLWDGKTKRRVGTIHTSVEFWYSVINVFCRPVKVWWDISFYR